MAAAVAVAAVLFRPTSTAFLFLFFLFSVAISDELHTLLSIKSALQSSNNNTNVFDTWHAGTPPCNFSGISCDFHGSVTEIDLSHQNLSGIVPFDSICSLESLEKLALGHNSLSGEVAGELNDCVGLRYLDLGNNFFAGPIPEIPSLNQMTHLYMNLSGFTGKIPWSSLENMSKLEVLSLGDNPFAGAPVPDGIVKLTRLNTLYLSNCSLEGKIPAGIGNLTELINLELSMNDISGEIPTEITNLRNLRLLELYSNNLTGKFPVGFGNLSDLESLDASMNNLSGDLSEIRYLNKLKSLQLFYNQFSGEVPAELGEFKNLIRLSLYGNKLTGKLPLKLGSWAEFDFIDVSENFLTGPIPPEMCKQGKMTKLLILQNNFTGEIPESYASCRTLNRFRVSKNSLSGEIPSEIWGLPNIEIIDLSENKFQGRLTSDIGKAKKLGQLFLGNNNFSGNFPPEISGASELVSVDVSNNQFSGEIPATIGDLKKIYSLYLSNNKFSGSIPDSLGFCVSLSDITLAQNSLTGDIPGSLGFLSSLTSLNLSGNRLSGQIPETLSSLKLNLIDFSNNQLTGPIPESLSVEAYNGSFAGNSGLCGDNIKHFRRCSGEFAKSHELHPLLLCFVSVPIAILVSLACCFLYLKRKKDSNGQNEYSLKQDSWSMKSFHLLSFTEDEIIDSIKQDNLIGKGGSGSVYRVVLRTGKELAVKHIWNSRGPGPLGSTAPMLGERGTKSKEFEAEVETLSSIRHVNIVKLYCSIMSEDSSLLVYEYLPNGSLWDRLHGCGKAAGPAGFGWGTRYEVAVGAARGLEYLHHGCDRPVIHRDVKSSNILLDEDFKPRIADFGLAKIVQPNCGKDSSHLIAGTHGYIAPEYGYTHKVNAKSDVYSFGVVLMELVSGKRPIEAEYGDNNDIVRWVSSKLKNKESVLSIIDSSIQAPHKEDALKVLKIAIMCTARLPSLRPSMRNVVKMLEDLEPCRLLGIIVSKEGGDKFESCTPA